jgi:NADPH:quinone reductase-like Zn-dependent oxidoreductase
MRACRCTEHGSADVLRVTEISTPVPANDEVLIGTRAASVDALDWRLIRGRP